MKRPFSTTLGFLVVLLLATSCAGSSTPVSVPTTPTAASATAGSVQPDPTATSFQGRLYTDAKLGFQITTPTNWQAQPQSGTQKSPGTAAVTFTTDEQTNHAVIVIGIFHGPTMPGAFAARGTPTTRVGPYPAFVADRLPGEGRAPCLVRIFLAHEDYVIADWCAPDAFAFRSQFEQVLATYQPASPNFVARTEATTAPQTCAGMQRQLGYAEVAWGKQLATPTAAGWRQVKSGVFVCSNDSSSDWYLFQCTELVNRFLYERWALPHLPGNAARYFDYYQNGVLHQGTIHQFPAGSYQLSNDASQGESAFRPVAGDILVYQDVNNPRVGWTSGLTSSPGHVAMIVGVDSSYVYVAQENYSDAQYFLALPFHKVANGYEITDLSGWSSRIVRGWIHFTVNGGAIGG